MIRFFSALGAEALLEILVQSSEATAIYTGAELYIQFSNNAMLAIWGKDSSVRGKTFDEALPEMQGQPFTQLLKDAWKNGEVYEAKSMSVTLEKDGDLVTSYFDFIYKPLVNEKGEVYCILHTASDVTERVKAWKLVEEKKRQEQQTNEELAASNEEFQATNEELDALNQEFSAINEQLNNANQKITLLNSQLQQENDDLLFDNKGFQDNIAGLDQSTRNLKDRNRELVHLNNIILGLNDQLSDSKTSFANLIAQAPVAMMLVKGDDFIVTMINISMLELIGKDTSIVGKSLFEELPELKGQHAAHMLIETYEKGVSHHEHSNAVTINRGGKLDNGFFNFTYTPFIENGKVTGVIDMAMEVTPQVKAIQEKERIISAKISLEETLRTSEQRLHRILETMAEGVGVTDSSGQLVYANPMAQQILGLNESAIKDRTYDDPQWQNLRLDGSPLPSEEHPMSIMFATGKPVFDYEIGVQPPDRERFYISINAAPIFDSDGNISGGIGTFMDVTTRRMITQGKDDFISIASHELKTPVTALKAILQLLKRSHEKLPIDTRAKLLEQANKSLDKLSHLIYELLDTSRIEQGQLRLDKRPFALSELFDDCCSNLVNTSKQELIFEGATDEIVNADSHQIGQVIINFINNAIKYAPESEKIIIKAEKLNDKEIKISVKDNGPGIPKNKVEHLFERYYRTSYQGQKFTGLGLGLYISADIIKNHSGKVGVESELGKGSEFWFTLPFEA